VKKLVFALVLFSTITACWSSQRSPTLEEVKSAKNLITAHESGETVPTHLLEDARAVVAAADAIDDGFDWFDMVLAAGGALLGVPALGPRGRRIIGAGIDSLMHGDSKGVGRAVKAYSGASHSGSALGARHPDAAAGGSAET